MINDHVVESARLWKYVDDTTISKTVAKGELSNVQSATDRVVQWSLENRVHLNTDDCKEMRISFTKSQREFEPILINGDALEVVDSVKFLGLNINSSDLTLASPQTSFGVRLSRIHEIVKKASKKLYFLVQLRRAKTTPTDLGLFYSSCFRSIMDYAVPAFHFNLPKYLMQELERAEKRAMSITCPGVSYHEALAKELTTRHDQICESLFHMIVNDNNHRLYKLLG